jgi:DUF4097 and DUF4098 domain-containing protein YvlB
MNKRKAKTRGALLAAVLALTGFTGLRAQADYPLVNTVSISLGGIDVLSINYGEDELVLRDSESEDLIIREYMKRDNPRCYARVSTAAGTVHIKRGKRPWLLPWRRARAEIYIPASFHGSLRLSNSSGSLSGDTNFLEYKSIDISVGSGAVFLNRLSAETVSVRVSSGELDIKGMEGNSFISVSSGKLQIGVLAGPEHRLKSSSGRTRIGSLEGNSAISISSGSIALERVRGRLDLDISSGSLRAEDFSGEGGVEISSGDVNLDMRELTGDLRFRVSSGSIDVNIPAALGFNLDLVSKSGSLRINEQGEEVLRVSGNSTILRPFGPSPVRTIYARTNSGNITINRR